MNIENFSPVFINILSKPSKNANRNDKSFHLQIKLKKYILVQDSTKSIWYILWDLAIISNVTILNLIFDMKFNLKIIFTNNN